MSQKNKMLTGITFLIVFSMIALNVSANIETFNERNSGGSDDEISPLTNQGLILEVNRIRHRGLLEKIMQIGLSWKDKPVFYVESNMDGNIFSSYGSNGFTYNVWDTITQDFRIIRDVEEEKENSFALIRIMEKDSLNFVEKESFNVTYDYRTGCWTGDDYFNDSDGYGHFVGETYEIWFKLYQTDFDEDEIPYWTEVNILGTDPQIDDSKLDPDMDGIPTSWEWKWGYNPHIWDDHTNLDPDVDGIENIEEYQMRKWFSNPFSQDIYIETDGMEKRYLFDKEHVFSKEAQQIVIERFCQHKINVYIDDGWPDGPINGGGEILPYVKRELSWDSGTFLRYYKHYFSDERKEIFRYVVVDANMGGYCGNSEFNRFDTIVVGSSLKTIYLTQKAFTRRTQHMMLAASILHELGHSLGIGPNTIEGCDNYSFKKKFVPSVEKDEFLEKWGNYRSVMNYFYIYNKKLVDYSDGSHGDNDQNDWLAFYLPCFQIEHPAVCEPFMPITEKGIIENISVKIKGWNYSKELTEQFVENISSWSPVDPIMCNWSVFVKTNESEAIQPSDRNLRVYVIPRVPITYYSLYKEGHVDSERNIVLE